MSHRTQLTSHKPVIKQFRLKLLVSRIRLIIAGSLVAGLVAPVQAELPIPGQGWTNTGIGANQVWTAGTTTSQIIGDTRLINQRDDKVILNWEKFNVGKENTVQFVQPGTNSVALNRIYQQDPSQILGHVTANGQVYLVNPNGFVFGKDSTVDVHGLVASSLNVLDDNFNKGITQAVTNGQAAFEGNGEFLDANGQPIKIEIQKGAQIKTAEGGRIIVLAPTILNSGNVEAKGGQVILAAATDKVYLQEAPVDIQQPDGTITNQVNSDVRGLLVEVKTGGKVENLGTIAANRGNVTLMGFAVNQGGKVSATTSTSLNGTIRLLAREGGG